MRLDLFKKKINLELYYQVKELIRNTTKATGIVNESTFGWKVLKESLSSKYNILYLGEFLANINQKKLNTYPEIRAIALAVADCYDAITDNMYNNNQLLDFIQTVYACCGDDIYLSVAAYKLVKDPKLMLGLVKEIQEIKLNDFADNYFVAMEFNKLNECWTAYAETLAGYLTKQRNFGVYENVDVYVNILKTFKKEIQEGKSAADKFFKLLLTVSEKTLTDKSPEFKKLAKLGYSEAEIFYLNYILVSTFTPKTERVYDRTRISYMLYILNNEVYNEKYFNEITPVIEQSTLLQNKCFGNNKIKDIISENVTIKNVDILQRCWEYRDSCISNTILNMELTKVDCTKLYNDLGDSQFFEAFRNSMIVYCNKSNYDDYIKLYETLTGNDLLETVTKKYKSFDIFKKILVYQDIIYPFQSCEELTEYEKQYKNQICQNWNDPELVPNLLNVYDNYADSICNSLSSYIRYNSWDYLNNINRLLEESKPEYTNKLVDMFINVLFMASKGGFSDKLVDFVFKCKAFINMEDFKLFIPELIDYVSANNKDKLRKLIMTEEEFNSFKEQEKAEREQQRAVEEEQNKLERIEHMKEMFEEHDTVSSGLYAVLNDCSVYSKSEVRETYEFIKTLELESFKLDFETCQKLLEVLYKAYSYKVVSYEELLSIIGKVNVNELSED